MRIKELLSDRDITQVELAKRLGWTPQRLNSRLKNNNPTYDTILRISKAIPCEIHELFETSKEYGHWYDKGDWLGIRKK